MKDFKKYWDKKAQKRRKSWESKLARRKEQHIEIEEIRKQVFLPLNKVPNFDNFYSYKEDHYTEKNPLAEWKQGSFSFSEKGLKDALMQRGCDLGNYKVKKEHTAVEDGYRHATDLDTLTITFGQVIMIIKRYSTKGVPFGTYEIIPCTRLVDNYGTMRMEETGFYTLDIATFLMEMDAECALRDEEFLYYTKELKLASLEGLTANDITFKLWDDAKIPEKVKSLVDRYGYRDVDSVLKSALKPWMTAVKEFMENITMADKNQENLIFSAWERNMRVKSRNFVNYPEDYVKNVLRPYLDALGLQDAKVSVRETVLITIEYQGCQLLLKAASPYALSAYQCYFYPYAEETYSFFHSHYGVQDIYNISFSMLTLSAIARYVKLMPKYKDTIDDLKAKVIESFNIIING